MSPRSAQADHLRTNVASLATRNTNYAESLSNRDTTYAEYVTIRHLGIKPTLRIPQKTAIHPSENLISLYTIVRYRWMCLGRLPVTRDPGQFWGNWNCR